MRFYSVLSILCLNAFITNKINISENNTDYSIIPVEAILINGNSLEPIPSCPISIPPIETEGGPGWENGKIEEFTIEIPLVEWDEGVTIYNIPVENQVLFITIESNGVSFTKKLDIKIDDINMPYFEPMLDMEMPSSIFIQVSFMAEFVSNDIKLILKDINGKIIKEMYHDLQSVYESCIVSKKINNPYEVKHNDIKKEALIYLSGNIFKNGLLAIYKNDGYYMRVVYLGKISGAKEGYNTIEFKNNFPRGEYSYSVVHNLEELDQYQCWVYSYKFLLK